MSRRMLQKFSGSIEGIRRKRNARRDFRNSIIQRNIELPIQSSKESTDFRIAHITDQHVGRVTPMELQQAAISMANEASPDLVVLTGDFVCHSDLFLEDLSFLLRQLRAPAFAVLGNHDHWTNAPDVKNALLKAGVEVLENKNTLLELRKGRLQLIGLDDAYTNHDDIRQATRGLTKGIPTIGLSHIAEKAEQLWAHGSNLVLSGHTHAGQVTVAGLNELLLGKIAGHKYIHGLYKDESSLPPDQWVYVGAGVGSAIIPYRIGEKAKREITIFDFKTHEF